MSVKETRRMGQQWGMVDSVRKFNQKANGTQVEESLAQTGKVLVVNFLDKYMTHVGNGNTDVVELCFTDGAKPTASMMNEIGDSKNSDWAGMVVLARQDSDVQGLLEMIYETKVSKVLSRAGVMIGYFDGQDKFVNGMTLKKKGSEIRMDKIITPVEGDISPWLQKN